MIENAPGNMQNLISAIVDQDIDYERFIEQSQWKGREKEIEPALSRNVDSSC